MKWRMKTETNDSLRQRFVNRFGPAAVALGLKINVIEKDEHGFVTSARPDENYQQDAVGNWAITSPDWDEFWRVIRGNGPCNRHRINLRRFSYEQGAWVRRALAGGSTSLPPAA
jgi:ring-1,2-phenylacetyl-CoA epoxidase subunit PaaA